VALFLFGCWIMDRFGRAWAAVPSLAVLGIGLLALPAAGNLGGLLVVAAAFGLGNGISAGVVLTLGSDASPQEGRNQFLGGFRLINDVGIALGPLSIAAITTAASLAVSSLSLGAFALAGAGWLGWGIHRILPKPT
jgi:MFS family permease